MLDMKGSQDQKQRIGDIEATKKIFRQVKKGPEYAQIMGSDSKTEVRNKN